MSWELFVDVLLDALKDSAIVFGFIFALHLLLSFFENKMALFLIKYRRSSVVISSLFGLIPECGTSVLGAELYLKRYISIGALIALFLSCSDEALIAILASGNGEKMLMVLPLLGIKLISGITIGLVVDYIIKDHSYNEEEYHDNEVCEVHHLDNSNLHKHFIHPLIHSLFIFLYVLVINLVLGLIIKSVGEANFASFLSSNKYVTPIYAALVGLIPNCASSLLISELFINNALSFGALVSGLLVNSGLGMMILLKNRKNNKNILFIILICMSASIVIGYITCLISGF